MSLSTGKAGMPLSMPQNKTLDRHSNPGNFTSETWASMVFQCLLDWLKAFEDHTFELRYLHAVKVVCKAPKSLCDFYHKCLWVYRRLYSGVYRRLIGFIRFIGDSVLQIPLISYIIKRNGMLCVCSLQVSI